MTLGKPLTLQQVGRVAAARPSTWYMWIVRPPMATIVSSQKPYSLIVSVCGMDREIVAVGGDQGAVDAPPGEAPKSSWIFTPKAPPATDSSTAPGIGAAAAQEAEVQAVFVSRPDQLARARWGRSSSRRTAGRAHADHGRDAARQRMVALLGREEMRVRLHPARRDDDRRHHG